MHHADSAVVGAIGLLCVVSVIRKRRYQKQGTEDPLKPWALGAICVLGFIAAIMLIIII